MKKVIIFLIMAALVLVATPALLFAGNIKSNSGDAFDNWKGTLGFVDVERNDGYDSPSGRVMLNYNSDEDVWVVNLVAKGLDPQVKYQVIFHNGTITSLGCGYPNSGGVLHIKSIVPKGEIDPTKTFSHGNARVNVRLAASGGGCSGVSDSAVLTTVQAWGGSDLIPVGSNRPE